MKSYKHFVLIVLTIALVFGISSAAQALCWVDSYGTYWKLGVGPYTQTKISKANGYQQNFFTCNGTQLVPVTGSLVRNAAGDYVLGVWSAGNEPGVCWGVSWMAVINRTTLNGTGSWRNQGDFEGSFTLSSIPCSSIPASTSAVGDEFHPGKVSP